MPYFSPSALTTAALLFVFAGPIAEPVSARHLVQSELIALQNVPALPPETVAPPSASKSTLPQSDAPPQAPTQNWALPTPQPTPQPSQANQPNNQNQNNQNNNQTQAKPVPSRPQTVETQMQPSQTRATPRAATSPASVRARRGKKTPEPQPVAVVPAQPEQPSQPLRPSQMPPTPPRVVYRDGLLSIVAENSTLADILTAVRTQTGATIDIPSSASSERVVMHVGPGPPRDVVSALLSGSPFDYVILGAENNPTALRRVIVSARDGAGMAVSNPSPVPSPGSQRSPMPGMGAATAAEAEAADQGEETPPPQRVAQPMTMPGMGAPTAPAAGAGQPANPAGSPPTLKTPEQLLEELKRMQQQQQQQPPPPQQPSRPPGQ